MELPEGGRVIGDTRPSIPRHGVVEGQRQCLKGLGSETGPCMQLALQGGPKLWRSTARHSSCAERPLPQHRAGAHLATPLNPIS